MQPKNADRHHLRTLTSREGIGAVIGERIGSKLQRQLQPSLVQALLDRSEFDAELAQLLLAKILENKLFKMGGVKIY